MFSLCINLTSAFLHVILRCIFCDIYCQQQLPQVAWYRLVDYVEWSCACRCRCTQSYLLNCASHDKITHYSQCTVMNCEFQSSSSIQQFYMELMAVVDIPQWIMSHRVIVPCGDLYKECLWSTSKMSYTQMWLTALSVC